jgi:hypothetical protein
MGQQRDPSWTLVHGRCTRAGFGYAWLERDGMAYRPVLDRFQPVAEFYREQHAVPVHRYHMSAAARAMIEAGWHWGLWDTALEMPQARGEGVSTTNALSVQRPRRRATLKKT